MLVNGIPKMVSMIYAIAGVLFLTYLFYKDKFNKKIGFMFLIISSILGFLIVAPMFPHQFQLLVLRDTSKLGAPIPLVIVGFLLFIILTAIFGRIFCGYICPIGAVQELLYHIPVKKFKIKSKTLPLVIRGIFFTAFLISGLLFSIGILNYIGVAPFFNLR